MANPQGHERHELAAEGAEVKALAKGFERAVSGEVPQPGVDSQEPCEGEPSGIGEGRLDRGEPRETKPRRMHGSSRTARRTPGLARLERPVSIRARRDGTAMASA